MAKKSSKGEKKGVNPKSLDNLKPWQPGQSGNPAGRPSAGATQREWYNVLSAQGMTVAQLWKIARDAAEPFDKRAAAEQALHTLRPRMADYEDLVEGRKTLAELEAAGIDTSLIKKIKVRQEVDDEGAVTAVTREVELHNVAGESLDRIADRTDGRPKQSVDVTGAAMPHVVEIITPGTRYRGEPAV